VLLPGIDDANRVAVSGRRMGCFVLVALFVSLIAGGVAA
jgi:hypothetical protein